MNHEQYRPNPRLNRNSSKCVPPLFTRFVDPVRADEASLIFKDEGRQLE